MKLLLLEGSHRSYLIDKAALMFDADGREYLVGLSSIESVMYVRISYGAFNNNLPDSLDDLSIFLDLHERHTNALRNSTWIFNATCNIRLR
jgi:hypothetical protein